MARRCTNAATGGVNAVGQYIHGNGMRVPANIDSGCDLLCLAVNHHYLPGLVNGDINLICPGICRNPAAPVADCDGSQD